MADICITSAHPVEAGEGRRRPSASTTCRASPSCQGAPRPQMRAVLEDHAGGRHRPGLSGRDAARRRGPARGMRPGGGARDARQGGAARFRLGLVARSSTLPRSGLEARLSSARPGADAALALAPSPTSWSSGTGALVRPVPQDGSVRPLDPGRASLVAAMALVAGCARADVPSRPGARADRRRRVGNAIDRVAYGAVFDFVHLHAGGWSWYVFNIADAAIVAGVVGLILDSLRPAPSTRFRREDGPHSARCDP